MINVPWNIKDMKTGLNEKLDVFYLYICTALRNHSRILLLAGRIYCSFQLARVQDTLKLGEWQNDFKNIGRRHDKNVFKK